MGFSNVPFSVDPTAVYLDAVEAGDADEMESRLATKFAAVLADNLGAVQVTDIKLTGVGKGPGWACGLFFGQVSGTNGTSLSINESFVRCAVASNRQEAYGKLMDKLAALNAQSAITFFYKIEVAGNGEGSAFMALAIGAL